MDRLELSRYRFTLEAKDKISLPEYKGSTFHGGFGRALMDISPTWYRYFFNAGKNGDLPKPFVILPPLNTCTSYEIENQFQCDLTLFGEATQHYAIAQAAVEYLGEHMGLGNERGKYRVLDIEHTRYESDKKQCDIQNNENIQIEFPTRLRLKAQNKLYKQSPTFSLLMERLLGRLKTLEKLYMGIEIDWDDECADLINKSKSIEITDSKINWEDWDRFSGRQKKWMKFGGLKGNLTYTGNLQPFIELLSIGEWMHIGGKTSFGLGKYEMHYQGVKV